MKDPIKTVKTFDIYEDDEIMDEEDDLEYLHFLEGIRYNVGMTDRHGIPLEQDEWTEHNNA